MGHAVHEQTVERPEFYSTVYSVLCSNGPEQAFCRAIPFVAVVNGKVQAAGKGQYSHVLHGENRDENSWGLAL